jgi:hypothetical protein
MERWNLIKEIVVQVATSIGPPNATATSTSLSDLFVAPWIQQLWSYVLQAGSLSGLGILLLSAYRLLSQRLDIQFPYVRSDMTARTIIMTIRFRNKSERPTAVYSVYHEWGDIRAHRHHLPSEYGFQDLVLVEDKTKQSENGKYEKESGIVPYPVLLRGGATKTYRVQLTRTKPEQKHQLVIDTTYKRQVRKLPRVLFNEHEKVFHWERL